MSQPHNTPEQQPAMEQNGRDENGRFRKGNAGGPGNPFARQTARMRQAVLDAVTEDDLRDIVKAMKEKAKQGDVAAAKLILSYSAGKPTPTPDPDTLDRAELDTMATNHIQSMESAMQVVEGLPLSVLTILLREALPILNHNKWQFMMDHLRTPAGQSASDAAAREEKSTPEASGRATRSARQPSANDMNGKHGGGNGSRLDRSMFEAELDLSDAGGFAHGPRNGQPLPMGNGGNGKMPGRCEG